MKKSKAIAIFCVLFIILLVLVVSTSNYLSKNNIDRKNMLAAVVEGSGGGGTSTTYYATNTFGITFSTKTDSSISCNTDPISYRNAFVTKTLITIQNNDKTSTVAMGCVYSNNLTVGSTFPASCNDGAVVARQLIGNVPGSQTKVKIYVCPDINQNSDSEGTTSGGSTETSTGGGDTQSGSSQTDENSSTQGAGKESGTVKSGICDEPRLEYNNLCASEGFRTASKIAGTIILFAKWIAPLLLIILGMIDFGKAFLSGDDKSLTDATTTFIKRLVIAIIIPLVPSLLYYLIGFFTGEENPNKDENFVSCTDCLKHPLDKDICNVVKYNYDRCKK